MSTDPKHARHTSEPWETSKTAMRDGSRVVYGMAGYADKPVACVYGAPDIAEPEAEANAARIVACVNACAGIEDPSTARALARELAEWATAHPRMGYGCGDQEHADRARLDMLAHRLLALLGGPR